MIELEKKGDVHVLRMVADDNRFKTTVYNFPDNFL